MSKQADVLATGTRLGPDRRVAGPLEVVEPETSVDVEPGSIAYVPHSAAATNNVVLFYDLAKAGVEAICCERLGRTDHGVLLANELGIPCLSDVDPSIADRRGETVTVSGRRVHLGKPFESGPREPTTRTDEIPETDAAVKINLGFPEVLDRRPSLVDASDGVGFMRLEFLLLDVLGNVHPAEYVERHGRDRLERALADRIEPVLAACDDPVWIRTDDFAPEHLRTMDGGRGREPTEENPMLGWRGIARSLDDPIAFDTQLGAVARLVDRGYENVGLFPPMTRFPREYRAWRRRAEAAGLDDVALGVMVETPAAALTFERFVDDVAFVVFGSNDLTQFTLAIDRNNEHLRAKYDETEPAVLALFERVIDVASDHGVTTCIGGQAASDPALIRHLLAFGIDAFSVTPSRSAIVDVRRTIAPLEAER